MRLRMMMSMRPEYSTRLLVVLGVLATPFALAAEPGPLETHAVGSVLGEDVQCLLAPSAAYKPGTVFRIDQQHVSYFVDQTFTDKIPTREEEAVLGFLSGRDDINLSVLAWLLRVKQPTHSIASWDGIRRVDVRFDDVTWEHAEDAQINAVVDRFAGYQHKREGSEYFVVREAWKVGSMHLKLTTGLASDLGAEGSSIPKLLHANYELKYAPAKRYNLSQSFPQALRVCIRPERLVWGSGSGSGSYRTEPVHDRLTIVRQDADQD